MSTSQRAVMLCGWGVNAGMTCLQVKQCVAISERFRKCIWYLKALYKCPGLLLMVALCNRADHNDNLLFTSIRITGSIEKKNKS